MIQELWDEMAERQRSAGEAHKASDEHERRTMADLLLGRGEDRAATIVAMSSHASVVIDSWNGGQYQVSLPAVPGHANLIG